jgi:hypothetical protein
MLHNKYLCSIHFLESDFTTAERIHLNKGNEPHTVAAGLSTLASASKEHCIAFSQLQYFIIKAVIYENKAGKFFQVIAPRM